MRGISVLYGLQHSGSRAVHTEIPLKGTDSRAIYEIFNYYYLTVKNDHSQCDWGGGRTLLLLDFAAQTSIS